MAQVWPGKTVRIIVPFSAGSTPDIVARLMANGLTEQYPGSTFLVENKPGASGNIGTDMVAKAAPDGSTLGVSIGGPLAINTLLFSQLPYDPAKDIAPIAQLVTQPSALAVNPGLKVNTVGELIALLKANPGKYNFASIGNGSLSHLAMEAVALKAGTKLVHVPYPSSPQAMTAVIRGDAQIACLPAIAVTPDVPTLTEVGVDVEADAWNGLIAPGGTAKVLIDQINRDVVAIMQSKKVRDKLTAQLMEPVRGTPEEFRARIDGEIARWAPVIKAAKIQIN
jgi:tripartite-type tricarboxylate transporter receptor subunit TctC